MKLQSQQTQKNNKDTLTYTGTECIHNENHFTHSNRKTLYNKNNKIVFFLNFINKYTRQAK